MALNEWDVSVTTRDLGYLITLVGLVAVVVAFAMNGSSKAKIGTGIVAGVGALLVLVGVGLRAMRWRRDGWSGSPSMSYLLGWKGDSSPIWPISGKEWGE